MEADVIKVMEKKWDYLIVLDACRYDYFSNTYKDYFLGELKKGISTGSSTPEWCKHSFPNFYSDIIYISGNPYINSKQEVGGFYAKNHFFKVIDVWDFGWSDKLNTVLPKKINEYTLNFVKKFPRKRFVIHYLQPHEPYLSRHFSVEGSNHFSNGLKWAQRIWGRQKTPVEELLNLLFVRTKLMKNTWKIRDLLNLTPIQPMDAVRRKYGINGLRKAYEINLKIVLENVSQLCKNLLFYQQNKNILITSDHGELLGEDGDYCHRSGRRDPILREVPIFRVKCVKIRNISQELQHDLMSRKSKKRSEGKEYTTLSIPTPLFKKVERLIKGTRFTSVSSYITYVLKEKVAKEEPESPFTKEDKEKLKDRLRALGYIEGSL